MGSKVLAGTVKTKNRKSVIHTGMLRTLEQTTEKGKTMNNPYWEVRRDGVPLASDPKPTMPDAKQRKSMREGGCKIYVEGKLFREGKNVAP